MTAAGASDEQPITKPATQPVATFDPARRPDVLLRVRKPAEHVTPWWVSTIGFLGFTTVVVLLLRFVPGAA